MGHGLVFMRACPVSAEDLGICNWHTETVRDSNRRNRRSISTPPCRSRGAPEPRVVAPACGCRRAGG